MTSLLARVALEPDQLREPLITAGLPASAWTRSLSAAERLDLRHVLESARARELVVAQATEPAGYDAQARQGDYSAAIASNSSM